MILFQSRNFGYLSIDRCMPEYKPQVNLRSTYKEQTNNAANTRRQRTTATNEFTYSQRSARPLVFYIGICVTCALCCTYRPYRHEKISLTARDFEMEPCSRDGRGTETKKKKKKINLFSLCFRQRHEILKRPGVCARRSM